MVDHGYSHPRKRTSDHSNTPRAGRYISNSLHFTRKYISNILHMARKYARIGCLSADIICSERRTVFRERSSRKTVSFEEQTMSNAGEVRYNTAHRRTRCIIKRCFGLLKRRFPCLHLGLRTALANTLVIVATAVLHNFALIHREQDFDLDTEDENVPFYIIAAADASGNAKRQLIISRYFA